MIILQIITAILITLLPGYLLLKLFRIKKLSSLDSILYLVGLGVIFNTIVGLLANFVTGFNTVHVIGIYMLLLLLLTVGVVFASNTVEIKWQGWKPFIIPCSVFVVALLMQYQTTLISSSLIGSDIQLEYYYSNWTLSDSFWNPTLSFTTMTSALGVNILLPFYNRMTGMDLILVYKIITPLIFAVLPLILYRIFRLQFGEVISILACMFFITMPMYTMDLPQLIRQEQSELFFMLAVLVVLSDNLSIWNKIILGSLFGISTIVMHYGLAIGFIGYMFGGFFITLVLLWWWRKKNIDKKPVYSRFVFIIIGIIAVISYVGYYSNVNGKLSMWASSIPSTIVERTVSEAQASTTDTPMDSITGVISISGDADNFTVSDIPKDAYLQKQEKVEIQMPSFFKRFPFLNPFWREPLVQTAIGLDFGRASIYGKIWRVFQYIVELCLIIGFLAILFKPRKDMKHEYMALVITSFFIIVGLYVLSTYSYGMGVARIWQITLLFMSPCFVIGASMIGKLVVKIFKMTVSDNKIVLISTLLIFIPYFAFNSGIVFELAKLQPKGFIDVPYALSLSGNRTDLAGLFEEEDTQAVDWLKDNLNGLPVYADANGVKLLIQRMGITMDMDLGTSLAGTIRLLEKMKQDGEGYIFLRKLNVDRQMFTFQGEYASRRSYSFDELDMIIQKMANGQLIYDNGARIYKVE
jgi:uncharacterized membrane protein